MEKILTVAFITGFLAASLRMAVPVLFTALGECLSERAGILNIGLEGFMLTGALAGFGAAYFGSVGTGIVAALVVGGLLGALVGLLTITLRADQVVVGISLNIFALGLTAFAFRTMFADLLSAVTTQPISTLPIPGLSGIPIVGPSFFSQSLFGYVAFCMVPLVWFVLFKTVFGLRVRAVGEMPEAADSVGISVYAIRDACVIFAGAMGGLGGAFLSLASINLFVENITAGRGFMALAAVIFGGWHPWKILGACLLFGAADALQLRMQALHFGLPHEFLLMLPYVLTLLLLFTFAGRAKAPAAMSKAFVKESR